MPSVTFVIFAVLLGIGLSMVNPAGWTIWRRVGLVIAIYSAIGLAVTQIVERLSCA